MSAFGRDLVGNANCGTANPLMQMAGQMQGMGQTLADVRSFSSVDKGGMLGPARPMQPDMMRPAMQTPETSHFLQQAPQGVFSPMGLPLHLQQQQQRPMPQMHGMPAGADLADQFMQMEMQAKQKDEFERAFNAPHAGPSGGDWAMEFQHKQQQQLQMQQQHRMMAAQRMMQQQGSAPMMNAGYDQMMMRSRMMGMPYMPSMMNQMHTMHHMPPMTASSIPAPVAKQEAPTATVVEQTDDLAEDNDVLEEAYKSVNSEEWANEFAQQESMNNNGGGLAGGMDKDMLHKLMTSDNPKWRNSKFLKFIDKISKGEIEFRDNQAIERPAAQGEQWANEFTDTASSSAIPNWTDEFSISQNHPASWSDEFAQSGMMRPDAHLADEQTEAERFMEEHGEELLNDGEFKDFDWAQALAKAKEDLPKQEDPKYKFQENNPHATKDPNQAFEEGVRLFKEGRIKESIVAFEACVTKQADHADAWAYLGEAQAQNEDEQNAISAFLQCVAIDPYNLKALLQLGISYTNDFEEHRALGYLKTWMQNNPAYHALSQQKQNVDEYLQFYGGDSKPEQYSYDNTLHDEVTKMFLNALTIRPDDADLHTVLGVLYHISSDFDKAIEAFKNAVKLKPDDAALWNKLGATLANSNKGADAVHAYKRALQLRPTFVRALANLAISFANQGLHQEAVQGYLATLAHNPEANHVWGYLRISLAYLKRDDLIELSHQKNVELFRPFFQF